MPTEHHYLKIKVPEQEFYYVHIPESRIKINRFSIQLAKQVGDSTSLHFSANVVGLKTYVDLDQLIRWQQGAGVPGWENAQIFTAFQNQIALNIPLTKDCKFVIPQFKGVTSNSTEDYKTAEFGIFGLASNLSVKIK